ncbi:NADH-quinone oxidoreductase subunit N [Sulfurospirillum sp. 1612]|uniref:NADH-quinone oxidoreductase subunit N n=1 Tax=Sulfurospirillum sp. 1612 TaxID=3094835 RepID=UPI002F948B0E
MKYDDIIYLLPLLSVGVGAVVLMLLSPIKRFGIGKLAVVTIFFLGFALFFNALNYGVLYSVYPYKDLLSSMLIEDTFSGYFTTIILAGGVITVLVGTHYFEKSKMLRGELFSLLLFSVFGMLLLVQSSELFTSFIALEIASISLYVMIGFQKNDLKRVEGSFRYLVLGSLAGVVMLLGITLIYARTGSTNLLAIGHYINAHPDENMLLVITGGTLIMITFLFKISAFPFQNWSMDVYDGAPLPVTAFMASTFKVAIFGFMLRIILVDFQQFKPLLNHILIYITILTLLYGSFLAIFQTSIKRMLAASSIVHTGYLLIAFVSIGSIGEASATSIIFYLIAYFLSSMGAFGMLSYIASDDHVRVTYEDFRGFSHIRPYMAAMMGIFMLSLAGIPSTIGFIGKFYIFVGAIETGNTILAVVGILATFVSVYYYFKLIALMYFYPSSEMTNVPPLKGLPPLIIGLMAIAVIWGGIGNSIISYFPGVDFLIDTAKLAFESLFIH